MTETPSAVDDNLILLEGQEAFAKHLLQLIQTARRKVYILSRTLNDALYHDQEIADALSALVRNDRNAEVCILVKKVKPLVELNHHLLRLARRLPSKITIKKLLIEPQDDDRAYLIGDRDLLLYQHDEAEFTGFVNYSAKPEVAKILDDFDYLWQRQSIVDEDLRSLHL